MENGGDLSDVINNLNGVAQNYGVVATIVAAVIGVFLAGWGALRLYDMITDHHTMGRSHDSVMGAGGAVVAICIGGLMTISAVLVAWFGLLYG